MVISIVFCCYLARKGRRNGIISHWVAILKSCKMLPIFFFLFSFQKQSRTLSPRKMTSVATFYTSGNSPSSQRLNPPWDSKLWHWSLQRLIEARQGSINVLSSNHSNLPSFLPTHFSYTKTHIKRPSVVIVWIISSVYFRWWKQKSMQT